MPYVPDPTDVTQPTDAVIAETAAAEFRALKVYIAANLGGAAAFSAKAWCVFDGTGALGAFAPIRNFGIPTIVKNGTGDYTLFFSPVTPSANYAMCGSVRTNSGSGQEGPKINNAIPPTINAVHILTTNLGTVADSDRISVIFFDHT